MVLAGMVPDVVVVVVGACCRHDRGRIVGRLEGRVVLRL